jgi:acyl-CoA thioester hydrolase
VSEFRIDLRVRFAETDAMGVAHHAAYLPYLETARVEYLRALGHPYRELRERDGIEFAVVGVDLRYHAPLRFDDAFTVTCALVARARATFSLAYRAELGAQLILSGRTRHAVLDRESGKPQRLPAWLAALPVESGRVLPPEIPESTP